MGEILFVAVAADELSAVVADGQFCCQNPLVKWQAGALVNLRFSTYKSNENSSIGSKSAKLRFL